MIVLGRLAAPWGLAGWLRVVSYTDPPEGLLNYAVWHAAGTRASAGARAWQAIKPLGGRRHGAGNELVVEIDGVRDREAARRLAGQDVAVPRSALPPLGPREYYWEDLLGLTVRNLAGVELGRVGHFVELPAHPVMVVGDGAQEAWIPLVPRHLKRVDLERGLIEVDWDAGAG